MVGGADGIPLDDLAMGVEDSAQPRHVVGPGAAQVVAFLGIAVWDDVGIVLTAAGFTALGALYYLFRRRHLRALGVDVDALVREEVEGLRSEVA